MTTAPHRVLCIGECLIDLIAEGGTDLTAASALTIREGGAPTNVAVGLARLGIPTAMCAVVGDDPFGSRLLSLLKQECVDVSAVRQTRATETTIAYAWRDERGDGHFRLVRMADQLLDIEDIDRARIDEASVIVVGSVALSAAPSRQAVIHAVELAAARGVPVVFDVNVRPTLWPDLEALRAACAPVLARATVIKLSLDDAVALWGQLAPEAIRTRLDAFPARIVVITDGGRPTWLRQETDGGWRRHDVLAVDAVEPTGAGDAFTAALVSRLLANGWGVLTDADIRFAMAAGAITTTKPGAIAALPTTAEIERFLAGAT
ncbi:MAG: carbohydrate kinase [Thermomicrobiales bacterium]